MHEKLSDRLSGAEGTPRACRKGGLVIVSERAEMRGVREGTNNSRLEGHLKNILAKTCAAPTAIADPIISYPVFLTVLKFFGLGRKTKLLIW
jgi:hypothetical protein